MTAEARPCSASGLQQTHGCGHGRRGRPRRSRTVSGRQGLWGTAPPPLAGEKGTQHALDVYRLTCQWASLVVRWLRLCSSTAGCAGLILVWGTKILHAAWHAQNKKEYFSWEFVITKTATPSVIKIAYWRSCHVIAQNQNSCVIFLNEWLQNKNHRTDGLETATPVNMLLINQGTKLDLTFFNMITNTCHHSCRKNQNIQRIRLSYPTILQIETKYEVSTSDRITL